MNQFDRDSDPDNPLYIKDSEAMDASDFFANSYHCIDLKDLKGITHLFNTIVPEVIYNKMYDKKKKTILNNIQRFEDHKTVMMKMDVQISQLMDKIKDKNDKKMKLII